MSKLINLIGKEFGRLVVLRRSDTSTSKRAAWICICRCGNTSTIDGVNLRKGLTKSCGCLQKEQVSIRKTEHGHSKRGKQTSEYNSWAAMKERCLNINCLSYKSYGAKGVRICDKWLTFDGFIQDMGPKPTPRHSLDRYPNQNGNYELSNCRWATPQEQQMNRTNNRWIEYGGIRMIITHWAAHFGITTSVLYGHIKSGKEFEEIFTYYQNKKGIQMPTHF